MHLLQYDSRLSAAKDNSITHAAAAPSNLDAAIALRPPDIELQNTIVQRATAFEIAARPRSEKKDGFETLLQRNFKRKITSAKIEKIYWQITIAALMQPLKYDLYCIILYLRTWQQDMTTFMRPLLCVLQHKIQEAHRTTHTGTTTRCNRRTNEGTFHRRLQQLYTEKRKVSCSGFLPNPSPMQHSCSHHNAFCSIAWSPGMYLRTWQHKMPTIMQPLHCHLQPHAHSRSAQNYAHMNNIEQPHVAEHQGRTDYALKQSQPHPPHTQGTFHRQLFTEKHQVSCSGFLPNTSPMRHSCSHYNAFCSITCLTRMSRHTWQQNVTTIMQPSHSDLQNRFQKTL